MPNYYTVQFNNGIYYFNLTEQFVKDNRYNIKCIYLQNKSQLVNVTDKF